MDEPYIWMELLSQIEFRSELKIFFNTILESEKESENYNKMVFDDEIQSFSEFL